MDVYKLSTRDVLTLTEMLSRADLEGKDVRVAFEGGLKVKVGGGMWSAPMGYADVAAREDAMEQYALNKDQTRAYVAIEGDKGDAIRAFYGLANDVALVIDNETNRSLVVADCGGAYLVLGDPDGVIEEVGLS